MRQYELISKNEKRNIFFNCIPFCIEKLKLTESDHAHIHEFSQLTIVTGGRGKIIVNNYEKNLTEGCVYVINSFTPHHLHEVEGLEIIHLLFHAVNLIQEPPAGAILHLARNRAVVKAVDRCHQQFVITRV